MKKRVKTGTVSEFSRTDLNINLFTDVTSRFDSVDEICIAFRFLFISMREV